MPRSPSRHSSRRILAFAAPFGLLASIVALLLPPAASAKVPDDFFGISAVLPSSDDLGRMKQVGFGAERFEISWGATQKTRKGGYDWAGSDSKFRESASKGLQPAPFVYGTPRFINKTPGSFVPPTESRANREEWQDFMRAAARRYGPDGDFWAENPTVPELPVRQWILWNEQNARAFWQPKPNVRDYATLIEITDEALADVNPKARIVLGGMYGYPKDERNIDAVDFFRKLYEVRGIEKRFEAISVHPYGGGVGTVKTQIKEARRAVRKAGDPNVDLLVGEIGWASSGPNTTPEVVGLEGQANRLREGLKLLVDKRRAWNIIGAYVYVWRDFEIESACLWCPHAGLLRVDGSGKPALEAVRKVIRSSR